jgi:hypothetical protein
MGFNSVLKGLKNTNKVEFIITYETATGTNTTIIGAILIWTFS